MLQPLRTVSKDMARLLPSAADKASEGHADSERDQAKCVRLWHDCHVGIQAHRQARIAREGITDWTDRDSSRICLIEIKVGSATHVTQEPAASRTQIQATGAPSRRGANP